MENLRIDIKRLNSGKNTNKIVSSTKDAKVLGNLKNDIEQRITRPYTFDGVFNPDAREFSITEVKEKHRFSGSSVIETVSREESRKKVTE